MSSYVMNRQVATEPFEKTSIETNVKSGFSTITQKGSLTKLQVVIGNKDNTIPSGSLIYVASENYRSTWASKVFVFEGCSIILVPEDCILLVDEAE